MNKYFFGLFVFLLLSACTKNELTPPPFNNELNLQNTVPVADTVMHHMEGIYDLADGSTKLGSKFVCKVSKHRVSFFSEQDGIFMILKYGLNPDDSSLQFAGFWRYSENSMQGNISFSIAKNSGVLDLLQNSNPDNIILEGTFLDVDYISRPAKLNFSRHFSAAATSRDFAIFAHHGVQTTANPPYSENSLNVVRNAQDYGVTGVEFDVRMTKDHVPICIHDPTINVRLTLKGPLSGSFDQYNYSLLSDYVRLIDGQKIPTVAEVLDVLITETNLKYMWLDIKGNTDIFKYLEPIVRAAQDKATLMDRQVFIITDLPTKSVIDEYKKQPSFTDLPTMCELTLQDVIDNTCEYWGPRYSEGLLTNDVNTAHSMGIKVYSWTLNDKKHHQELS
jgi:glycerophosphoryl diester phosphodiesterase